MSSLNAAAPHYPARPFRPDDWSWHDEAACAKASDADAHAMVTSQRGPADAYGKRLIAEYCDECPVVAQCARWAERDEAFTGIAGGTRWTAEIRQAQQQARVAQRRNRAVAAAEREWKATYG